MPCPKFESMKHQHKENIERCNSLGGVTEGFGGRCSTYFIRSQYYRVVIEIAKI